MPQTRDSIADIWGERTPYRGAGAWPVRVDEHTKEEPQHWVQSACVLCSNGCALDIGVRENRIVGVRGRAVDRVNHGRLGPKGLNGWQANTSQERLTTPLIRRGGELRPASWDEALDLVARQSRELLERYGSGAIGFYNTGQIFLEEYYALAMVATAGLRTSHIDGNTRLCTATAEFALVLSFGSDGQPGSFSDYDVTDCTFHIGHNMANTQTVEWMRLLDRRRGPNPPTMIVVDPRATATAREADLHLAPRLGTNVALMNGLLHLIIRNGHVDHAWLDAHTMGYADLERTVARYTPAQVEAITQVPARQLEQAAELLGTAPTLVSTVLQGVYQSNQATAAAVQVNNMHLVRGMIGKPGCTVFQMNGQPTAENTRECGASGHPPAYRNYNNPAHIEDLARIWNVDPVDLPHRKPLTHAMQIVRYAEEGSLRMLWVICTNPAVSLPELHRIRRILKRDHLFLVVQDGWLTETAALADVVLPAAIWGEKTGTFTNADRTVHISYKAIDPPGEARADFDIFLDYARRMDFRDKDGVPLLKFTTPEEAFRAWGECSRGRLCDYSGLTYEKLTGGSGIPWPCNDEHPKGTERLYTDGVFPTRADVCESYGYDLVTGAEIEPETYKAHDPDGRAIIRAADYTPPSEVPDDDYPLWLTTGRVVYHWHTRTKTGRAPELQEAAPDAFVEVADKDAARHAIREGDMVQVESRRGRIRVPARIGGILPGHVFVPFHYGYWDESDDGGPDGRPRAANELTVTSWDPVSSQPHFKFAAVRIRKA